MPRMGLLSPGRAIGRARQAEVSIGGDARQDSPEDVG
jgi:hypothetical protein